MALVQSKSAKQTTADRTPALTLTSAPTQGNLLVLCVSASQSAGNVTFATPTGWTAHPDGIISDSGDVAGQMFWKEAGAGETAAQSFTNMVSAARNWAIFMAEFDGGTGWAVDGHAENNNVGGSNTFTSGTTGTTTQAAEVAVSFVGTKSSSTPSAPTNSFTLAETQVASTNAANASGGLLYRILSATGTYSAGCSLTNARPWVGQIATFTYATGQTITPPFGEATADAVAPEVTAFTTPVLDDFNRADNTSSLGSNWTGSVIPSGWPSHGILSNQLYPSSGFKSSYWNTQFNADQEVFATLSTIATAGSNPWTELFVRIQNPNSASVNYYTIRVNSGSSFLVKSVAGTQTTIGGNYGAGQDGDVWGLQVIGTKVYVWRKRSGGWTLMGTVTDSDVSGAGYIGLASGDDATIRVDDFGGGSIGSVQTITPPYGDATADAVAPGAVVTLALDDLPPLLDDFNRADEDPIGGPNWTGVGIPPSLLSNVLSFDGGLLLYAAWNTSYAADQEAGFTLVNRTDDGYELQIWLRGSDDLSANDGVEFRIEFGPTGSGDDIVQIRDAFSTTLYAQSTTESITNGDVILARVVGTTAYLYQNGNLILSATDAGMRNVAGNPYLVGNGSVTTVDDFRAGPVKDTADAVVPVIVVSSGMAIPPGLATADAVAPGIVAIISVPDGSAIADGAVPTVTGGRITIPPATATADAASPGIRVVVTDPFGEAIADAVAPAVHKIVTLVAPPGAASADAVFPTLTVALTAPPGGEATFDAVVPLVISGQLLWAFIHV